MLRVLAVDLHVHTCLSPCATLDMTPQKIVARAREKKLSMIAVTDHNSVENVAAVREAAAGEGPEVLAGMELTTAEEAHLVALFGSPRGALALQELVYERLLPGKNDEELFGLQVVATAEDEVAGMNPRLLIAATTFEAGAAVAEIHRLGGLAIAAHIDREAYSLVGQLGFIPPDLALDAIEISRHLSIPEARERFGEYRDRPMMTASDAHDLDDLAAAPTHILAAEASFAELRLALAGREGRRILEEEA